MSDPRLPPRSILAVAEEVIEQVRKDERMDDALDAYAPGHENAHVRWLSKLRGYEVTLRFDAATFDRDNAAQVQTPRTVALSGRSSSTPADDDGKGDKEGRRES